MLSVRCVVLLLFAVTVFGQQYEVFRPEGFSSLQSLEFGAGPDPAHIVFHLTHVKVESDSCEGLNDILAVTFAAPIVGEVSLQDVTVISCQIEQAEDRANSWKINHNSCEEVTPTCASYLLEDDSSERRTILLFGKFVKVNGDSATATITGITLSSITVLVDGNQTDVYGTGPHTWTLGTALRLYDRSSACHTALPIIALFVIAYANAVEHLTPSAPLRQKAQLGCSPGPECMLHTAYSCICGLLAAAERPRVLLMDRSTYTCMRTY